MQIITDFIPSRVSGRGYGIGLFVSVCLSVSALTDEPFDVET